MSGLALVDVTEDVPKLPVVVVLGHIDHGKTSLLDCITSQTIALTEEGGITQCLRLHSLKHRGCKISLLDTPGHSLFEAIRLNTISVTDAAVLVVSIAEGVKKQTLECIQQIKLRKVPTLIAYTKLDRGLSGLARVQESLLAEGLVLEAVGGSTPEVCVSSKSGENIKLFLDTLCSLLEFSHPKCDIGSTTAGVILDVNVHSNQTTTASALVERGILISGQTVAIGRHEAKVKLVGSFSFANASMFVTLTGLPEGVDAGQTFCAWRSGIDFANARELARATKNAIIKADSRNSIGSVVALLAEHNIGVICAGLGEVTESNVLLARFASAWIVAFNTKVSIQSERLAQQLGVKLVKSALVYKLADAITELVKPVQEPARAQVLKVFPSDQNTIYGAKALHGSIQIGQEALIYRRGKLVFAFPVTIRSLQRLGCETSLVRRGQDFGFTISERKRIKTNDVLKLC
ncbi:MAG: GTP-binding protein [Candidatus Hodgkinia cicadicola]|nr:MAG: GTP-binding protein [Candidatus Hodgkinia cicadicola]